MGVEPSQFITARRRGGVGLPLVSFALLAVWLISPMVWLLVTGFVSPHSGIDPTPGERRAQGWVNMAEFVVGLGIPLSVLVAALVKRRRVLACVAAVALIGSNALLVVAGAPVWELVPASIEMIADGTA
jgi:hypothetical protein